MSNFNLDLTYYRGRVALTAILKALGIGKGDEVAIQAFTCVAVPEGVISAGAKPIYIDILEDGLNINPIDLSQKINSKTKAIVVQHTFGIPADIDSILKIANEKRIPVIEDCCHTLRSKYNGTTLGSFGIASFYSFEWGKPLVAGIGGLAQVNDENLRAILQNNYKKYIVPGFISNLRMELQFLAFSLFYRPSLYWPVKKAFHLLGDIGIIKGNYNHVSGDEVASDFSLKMITSVKKRLERKIMSIDIDTEKARQNGNYYEQNVINPAFKKVIPPSFSETVYTRFPLLYDSKFDFMKFAEKNRIEVADWYNTPAHPLKGDQWSSVYYEPGTCPNAERNTKRILSFPTHARTPKKDIERITNYINNF